MKKAYVLFYINDAEISIEVESRCHDCTLYTDMPPIGHIFKNDSVPKDEKFSLQAHKIEEIHAWTMDILDYYKIYLIESSHII